MAEFDDHKEAGALRTIGEVATATGIKTHVLRYWEQQFPQLKPLKRSGGRRYYRPEDVALVERIDDLVNSRGYTLKGAKAALNQPTEEAAPASQTPPSHTLNKSDLLIRLKAIRNELKAAMMA